MSTQGATTSSPSSSLTSRWTYDIFLSFRGEDTRKNFTDHLYNALKRKGILTFRDDEKLERGKLIQQELLKAIERSRFAIVIFSKNYATSRWCLDELVHIVRCKKETGLTILPIFYNVDASHVRNQRGPYEKAFVDLEERFKKDMKMVKKWKAVLREVASISGWALQDRHEAEFIQDIVEKMMKKLSSKFSSVTKKLVGMESTVAELINSYLGIGNNVCMMGICGMGGLGKTTLARAVYDMYSNHFEGSSFIANVKEKSKSMNQLQQQLLEEILEERITNIWDIDKGINIIKNRLCHRKVLLVLDDVNEANQLEKLAGEYDWFGSGSWIIITTRDEHLLVKHGVPKIYKPDVLNEDDASKLFCLKAFKSEQPKEGYKQLSGEVVKYASGLPLALVTLGSFLVGRTKDEWRSTLHSLKKNPKKEIFDILKISYDGLEEMYKEIFLDIACFFRRWKKDKVIQILESCGFNARMGIRVLLDKSLLTIGNEDDKTLEMHDLLKEMGKKIVQLESRGKLGNQSRLWHVEDLFHVLQKDTATKAIQAIVVHYWKKDFNFEKFSEVFSKMSNLRLLIIDGYLHIPNALNCVHNELRYLSWNHYSLECLASSFQPNELIQLSMQSSKLKYLWKGVKFLAKLKYIDLTSSDLIRTPDFSGVPRLEKLKLYGCYSLVEIHPSIGQLSRLSDLDLQYCLSLTDLPSMSAKMESLTILNLDKCYKVRMIPKFKGIMKSLSKLFLGSTAIEELPPSSIECLTALTSLNLQDCTNLECLPSNIDSLRSLEKLDLSRCSKLTNLPENLWKIKFLKELHLDGMFHIKEVGFNGIRFLSSLKCLTLSGNRFVTLPASIYQLSKLQVLDLCNCSNLQSVPKLSSTVRYINAADCVLLEPSPALLRQSSLSRPCSHCYNFSGYHESSGGVAFTILNRYLHGLLHRKTKYDTSTKSKEDRSETEFQIIIPGCEIPRWLTHQCGGNSINMELPRNWYNSRWIGFALCASFYDSDVMSSGIRARVIAIGDMPHSHYSTKISFSMSPICRCHIWLLYLSRDNWFATVGNGKCSQINVIFETTNHKVWQCGVSLVYEQDKEELNQAIAQCSSSRAITYEGWDGFHHGFHHPTRSCDHYSKY